MENAKFTLGGYVKFQGGAVLSPPCGPCIWQLSGHLRLVFQYTPGGDVKLSILGDDVLLSSPRFQLRHLSCWFKPHALRQEGLRQFTNSVQYNWPWQTTINFTLVVIFQQVMLVSIPNLESNPISKCFRTEPVC